MPVRIAAAFVLLSTGLLSANDRSDYFEAHIRPLLVAHCVRCHGPDRQESGIRLDSRAHVLEGTDHHDALVDPSDPESSRLLQVIAWNEDDVQMPPDSPLPSGAAAAFRTWIQDGAVWPKASEFGRIQDARSDWRTHWAWQPVTRPDPPGPGHPVDAFIRKKLAEHGLDLSPRAPLRVLVRRLSVALTGLPPDRDDLRAAAQQSDSTADAWLDALTDRLLASPHFGERWGRHWLDVARYADTKGYVFRQDRNYPDAWRYRDWVIRAFNSDMPWDEFLTRQLAADRFPDDQTPDDLAAMGFLTLGRRFLNNPHDIIDDRIDVTMRGMMGLTVTCARCHDHKYDPVPSADYYSLYGIFDSSMEPGDAPSPLRMVDRPKPREPVIFVRGSAARRGDPVPRRFLTAFSEVAPEPFTDGSGRLELARAITSRRNPLTARVAVNRIWGHLFAHPLVRSPSDFGMRSDPPSHPELLDHLAAWFMDHDWSVKRLIRHIVTSETWRQSADRRPDAETVDPDNRLLARMSRTRLDFEAHRDAILAAAGCLDPALGGPSVDITTRPFSTRRTVYARIDRQNLPGLFRTFDFASPDAHAPQRYETTVPQQALFQLNSPFILDMSEAAARTARESGAGEAAAVRQLYEQILQRTPTEEEQHQALQFIRSDQPDPAAGWSYGCGTISPSLKRLESFRLLPVMIDGAWRGSPALPDPVYNWSLLTNNGGHPGNSRSLCVVRRWTAGRSSRLEIRMTLEHPSEQGDGITSIVLHNTETVLDRVSVRHAKQVRRISRTEVQPGDTIDFVTFCGKSASHDSFRSDIHIEETDGKRTRVWHSVKDFGSQNAPQATDAWTQLAQVLLLTNEFVFVD